MDSLLLHLDSLDNFFNMKDKNKKVNWKVVIYSIIALICLALVFVVDWIFIVPVLVLIWLNQKELMKKK